MTTLDIRNFTRSNPAPGIPFAKIAAAALPGWEISLVFAGEQRAQNLNITLRKKDYIPNVLSYETTSKAARGAQRSGEIIICPAVAKRQASSYDMSYRQFMAYLFIHGLLHLKGHPHGATMERYERAMMSRFGLHASSTITSTRNGTTHRNRH